MAVYGPGPGVAFTVVYLFKAYGPRVLKFGIPTVVGLEVIQQTGAHRLMRDALFSAAAQVAVSGPDSGPIGTGTRGLPPGDLVAVAPMWRRDP